MYVGGPLLILVEGDWGNVFKYIDIKIPDVLAVFTGI